MMEFSTAALHLILEAEGVDQPSHWPGGDSGITIGRGYDLGYEPTFARDWAGHLAPTEIAALTTALGRKGQDARAVAARFRDIHVSREAADAVFLDHSLPKYVQQTARAFPGFAHLPLDAQGALVSLVFNRGAGMDGERRREMRAIRDIIAADPLGDNLRATLPEIAAQFRAMKRLWIGQGVDGLLKRRDAEAALVESAAQVAHA